MYQEKKKRRKISLLFYIKSGDTPLMSLKIQIHDHSSCMKNNAFQRLDSIFFFINSIASDATVRLSIHDCG